ncbi:hypothetical protein NKI04_21630 [Mesorhizobium sp. M0814]|uniref:hypothetical protein n=1 Tax=Mesorhizobium sp. M0814 TaxID=2957004 RepID=UPI00333B5B7C
MNWLDFFASVISSITLLTWRIAVITSVLVVRTGPSLSATSVRSNPQTSIRILFAWRAVVSEMRERLFIPQQWRQIILDRRIFLERQIVEADQFTKRAILHEDRHGQALDN